MHTAWLRSWHMFCQLNLLVPSSKAVLFRLAYARRWLDKLTPLWKVALQWMHTFLLNSPFSAKKTNEVKIKISGGAAILTTGHSFTLHTRLIMSMLYIVKGEIKSTRYYGNKKGTSVVFYIIKRISAPLGWPESSIYLAPKKITHLMSATIHPLRLHNITSGHDFYEYLAQKCFGKRLSVYSVHCYIYKSMLLSNYATCHLLTASPTLLNTKVQVHLRWKLRRVLLSDESTSY